MTRVPGLVQAPSGLERGEGHRDADRDGDGEGARVDETLEEEVIGVAGAGLEPDPTRDVEERGGQAQHLERRCARVSRDASPSCCFERGLGDEAEMCVWRGGGNSGASAGESSEDIMYFHLRFFARVPPGDDRDDGALGR